MDKCIKKCSECAYLLDDSSSLRFAECCAPGNIDKGRTEALKFVGMDNPPNLYRIDYVSMQRGTGWFLTRLENRCGREGRWYKPKVKE